MALDLNNPEVKAAVEAMVTEAVERETTGLKSKNAELARKLKMAQDIKPEDFQRAMEERDAAQAKLADLEGSVRELKSNAKKLTEQLTKRVVDHERTIVDDQLTNALVKAGVRPEFIDMAKSLHRGNVKVIEEGAGYKAILGDKPIAEAVAEWASSDVGKHVVAAPANGGGGASGSKGSAGPRKVTQAEFNAMDATARKEGIQKGTLVIDG